MAFVMHISFDNTSRLRRRVYLFEYKGTQFKLVQDNPRKWADHLLTIIPHYDAVTARHRAFAAGSEFLSAFAWESGATVAVWLSGGSGRRDPDHLRKVQPTHFAIPRIAMRAGRVLGHELTQIPHIQTEEQRIALALFREARASNNDFLSFLFFWQVLEAGGGKPEDFVEETLQKRRHLLKLTNSELERLPFGGRTLGEYLHDDCRHAIAHIKRWPGRKELDLDNPDERMRLAVSTNVVEAFAETYIRHFLGLSKKLWLVRAKGRGFPRFVDEETLSQGDFRLAYSPKPWKLTKAKLLGKPMRSVRAMRRGPFI
jgi:hypothetical protein